MHRLPKTSLATAAAIIIAVLAVPALQASAQTPPSSGANDPASATGAPRTTVAPADAARLQQLQQQAKVKAEEARKQAQTKADDATRKVAEAQSKAAERVKQAQADAAGKLESSKLRLCQSREAAIDGLMGRIGRHGDDNLALIDTVSERTQQFYGDKQLVVEGYTGLMAAVTTARTAAATAAGAAADAQESFDCTVNAPQALATNFKELVQARNDALKDYRDAVKQLVQAVKAAAQAQTDTEKSADAADTNGGAQ